MDHVQLNTAKAEERLQELKLQAQRANVEKEKHSQSYQEYEAAIKEMKGLRRQLWQDGSDNLVRYAVLAEREL